MGVHSYLIRINLTCLVFPNPEHCLGIGWSVRNIMELLSTSAYCDLLTSVDIRPTISNNVVNCHLSHLTNSKQNNGCLRLVLTSLSRRSRILDFPKEGAPFRVKCHVDAIQWGG